MRATVDIEFECNAVRKNGAEIYGKFREPFSLEIAEPSDDEAPLATRWKDGRTGTTVSTRWYMGRHCRTLSAGDRPVLVRDGIDQHLHHAAEGYFGLASEDRKTATFVPGRMEEAYGTNRADTIAKAEAWAAGCFVADGFFWIPCPEPRYSYAEGEASLEATTSVSVGPGGNGHKKFELNHVAGRSTKLWRADRFEEALQAASEYFGATGLHRATRIEILMPETIRFDDDANAIVDTGLELLHKADRKALLGLPPAALRALLPLQEIFWTASEEGTTPEPEAVRDALETAVAGDEAFGGRYGAQTERNLCKAIQRWDNRPLDIARTALEARGPTP